MERTALKVLAAIETEKLMYKEAAEILGFSSTYLSNIKRSDGFCHVPRKAWEAMHAWAQTGKTLRGYKQPEQEIATSVYSPELSPTAPTTVPKLKYILTKEPEKKKRGPKTDKVATAKRLREEFEASKRDGAPDTSYSKTIQINPVTGVLITIEVTIKTPK